MLLFNIIIIICTDNIQPHGLIFSHSCRIVDGTEDSEGTESSLAFSFSTTRACPVSEPTSASASATGPSILQCTYQFTPQISSNTIYNPFNLENSEWWEMFTSKTLADLLYNEED